MERRGRRIGVVLVLALASGVLSASAAESRVRVGDLPTAAALSPARVVLGPDRRVRELRLDGLTFSLGIGVPLPPASYENLRATTSTIRLSDVGAPVTIRPPPPHKVVREPTPWS